MGQTCHVVGKGQVQGVAVVVELVVVGVRLKWPWWPWPLLRPW